jgi:superfamily II RNA helicase
MEFKGYTLNAFQVQAIEAINAGRNVLLSAPTGAGKTLVAEYAIEEAVAQGRRAIYTSPIKALSNQKFRDFKADGVEVGLMTGDLTLEPLAPVVIMTTEIFRNAVFENPERFDHVDFVIFDEIHFMDDPERGTVWEESLIFAPPHVRFVCLSATISNLRQFGRWLASIRDHELAVVQHTRRPVPLRHQLFHAAASFFNLAQRKRALQVARRQSARHAGRKRRPSPTERRHRGRRADNVGPHPAQQVLDHLQREGLLPVLFFCFSRKECEIKAERNLHRRLLDRGERQRMTELFGRICAQFELDPERDPVLAAIQRRALHGLGYHHAGVLPIHKEVVERLFTSGMLKMLFTTETFALGINMPARTVVFDSLRKFDGVSFDYMKARDYMQMAGRAGRQGIDREGLVISVLDDEALQDAPLADLFGGKVEPVHSRFNLSYSTILNLYQRMGAELVSAYDRSFAAFQAQTGSAKRRERARSEARAAMRARLAVLEAAAYIDADGLLARGRIAQQINGYEIQVTELLFAGALDDLNIHQLAATFAALVHEERRSDRGSPGRNLLGGAGAAIEKAIRRFTALERLHGFPTTIKEPDFGIVATVDLWSRGASIHELQELVGNDGGDFVRTLRMAVQMMRQLRATLGGGYSVGDRLAEAIVAVNRDVVDAKRQFELG